MRTSVVTPHLRLPSSLEPSWTRRFSFSRPPSATTSAPTKEAEDLKHWLQRTSPQLTFSPRHLQILIADLEHVEQTPGDRVVYVMPPRHAKTATVSERFPVYCLKKHPDWRVIGGSYAQSLANKTSRRARRSAEGEITISSDRDAVEEWETSEGGGYRAVGVGAGAARAAG